MFMKRRRFLALMAALPAWSAWSVPADQVKAASPGCDAVSSNGEQLLAVLDASGVDRLWLPGFRVHWQSGDAIAAWTPGTGPHTHCSAFAASLAMRLGVYLLHPPEHGQTLLSNAQMAWLRSEAGAGAGWRPLPATAEVPALAQSHANLGDLVVAVFENPDPRRAGHIAIVRPGVLDAPTLARQGPMVTQAGGHNALSIPLARGFRGHRGAWLPDGGGSVRFFTHAVDWTQVA